MDWLIHNKKLDSADRVQLILSYILQFILISSTIYFVIIRDWLNALLVFGIFLMTFIPAIVRKNYKVHLPIEFDLISIVFIFSALYLGEIQAYYTKYWWWDIILHTSSGFLLGILAFVLVYALNQEKKINLMLNLKFLSLFAFAFAVAMGAIWEIIEFILDQVLGTSLQHGSLVDTMWDLIVDSLGALVISILGYFYIKRGGLLIFDRIVHRFVDSNPHLFRKRRFHQTIKENIQKKIELSKYHIRQSKDKIKGKIESSKQHIKKSSDKIKAKFKRKKKK